VSHPAKIQPATVADLLAIPEERRRHEIVDGVLFEKDAASGPHGRAQVRLSRRLGPYDRRPGGRWPGGWWFASEVEVMFEPTQVFRPDISGWQRKRLPELPSEVPITVRPDWICEVLSQNKRNDLIKKKRVYHRHQVGHYWIVDPGEETLAVYRWHPDGFVEVLIADRTETVPPVGDHEARRAEPFDAVELRIGVLFGDDEDEE
jgi:Uma2 family endonuclease